jgi:hypothetical protein
MSVSTTYISLKDTAVLVRKALKARFPSTKFSVRGKSYAGGANLTVGWTDGPSVGEVEAVTNLFVAGRFNAMIDMAYSAYHWLLPDGTIRFAGTSSDGFDAGTVDKATPPVPGATMVHFASDYVHTRRTETFALVSRAVGRVLKARGSDLTPEDVITPAFGNGWTFTDAGRALDIADHKDGRHYARHFSSEVHGAIAGLNADTGLRFSRR